MKAVGIQWSGAGKNLFCGALCATLCAFSFSVKAQQPKKIPRVGFITGGKGPSVESFQRGLRDLGYTEGKNILVEYRYIEEKLDHVPTFVAELVQLKVDALVVTTLIGIRAVKQATKTIPIVIVTTQDPVATGIVDSLARPGGNITGVTTLTRELNGKRLELLQEVVPAISRVGVLWDTNAGPGPAIAFREYETAAGSLKIQIQSLTVQGPNPNLEGAFHAAAKATVNALITVNTLLLNRYPKRIAELAIKNRMPSMNELSANVEAGGLISYSANNAEIYRRAASYVDKILKGAKPADLPVEQPTRFEFVINLKTAKALNLTIPQSVLFRADRVIR